MKIFYLIFILLSANIYSQENCLISVSGKVIDGKTKEPISGVLIKEVNSQKFSVSDENGNFILENL